MYLAVFYMEETMYFKEGEVVVPQHVWDENGLKHPPGSVTTAHIDRQAVDLEEVKNKQEVKQEVVA